MSTGKKPSWLLILVDVAILVISLWLAFLLRFDFRLPEDSLRSMLSITPFVLALQLAIVYRCGVQRVIGQYISVEDLGVFSRAAVGWLVPMVGARLLLPQGLWRIPLGVTFIDSFLAVVGLISIRLVQRLVHEHQARVASQPVPALPVLLVGAGHAGAMVAREVSHHPEACLKIVGFVDDDLQKQGKRLSGLAVVGTISDLPQLVVTHAVDHVIVTIVDAEPGVMRRVVNICNEIPIRVRTVPGLLEIVRGAVSITKFRDVGMEDLLGRDPIRLGSQGLHRYLDGRTVMITGAGGSIGSELARQVAAMDPRQLLLVDRCEGALFEIRRELEEAFSDLTLLALIGDICDGQRMRGIFERYSPHVVVHAAAHKHVGMMEDNPCEAVKNNTFGTELIATMAGEFGVDSFVLISTDKAVNPSSVMGASKRLAEMMIQDMDEKYDGTRFIAVRFGNVMGSSGSVIPIFKDQVRQGGPVTVTHKDATRYFMTIPEASKLVLTAGNMGQGGEIMVLDMGQPVRILDLARNLITLSGYSPDDEIPIAITGLRKGEKLTEELYADAEEMELTDHPKIFVGRVNDRPDMSVVVARLRELIDSGDDVALVRAMHSAIVGSQLLTSSAPAEPSLLRGAR